MKQRILIMFLSITICLCGCARTTNDMTENSVPILEIAENESEEVLSNVDKTREKIPVNSKEETVQIEWNNERLAKTFTSIGDTLYFCQWEREGREASLYQLKVGEISLQKMNIEIPDEMDIYAMTSDGMGVLHLLFHATSTDSDSLTGMIRTIDSGGNTLTEVDISAVLSDKIAILKDFVVDLNGNYYLKSSGRTVCVSSKGEKIWEMDNGLLQLESSYVAALGKDGIVYMAYQKDNGTYIGEVDSTNGTLGEEFLLTDLDSGERILAMEQGTDSDLLLYGCASGAWAWNRESNRLEKRADVSEAELAYNEYIVNRGFLEDGRLLLVKNISEGDDLIGITCQYIPAGN